MPTAPPRPCNHAGCGALTHEAYCPEHKAQRQKAYEQARGSAHSRGYGAKWRKARAAFLAEHPLCVGPACQALPLPKPSNEVDHIIPHRGDMKLFWRRSNWQALCHTCHSIKTAREDGRWGQK